MFGDCLRGGLRCLVVVVLFIAKQLTSPSETGCD